MCKILQQTQVFSFLWTFPAYFHSFLADFLFFVSTLNICKHCLRTRGPYRLKQQSGHLYSSSSPPFLFPQQHPHSYNRAFTRPVLSFLLNFLGTQPNLLHSLPLSPPFLCVKSQERYSTWEPGSQKGSSPSSLAFMLYNAISPVSSQPLQQIICRNLSLLSTSITQGPHQICRRPSVPHCCVSSLQWLLSIPFPSCHPLKHTNTLLSQ